MTSPPDMPEGHLRRGGPLTPMSGGPLAHFRVTDRVDGVAATDCAYHVCEVTEEQTRPQPGSGSPDDEIRDLFDYAKTICITRLLLECAAVQSVCHPPLRDISPSAGDANELIDAEFGSNAPDIGICHESDLIAVHRRPRAAEIHAVGLRRSGECLRLNTGAAGFSERSPLRGCLAIVYANDSSADWLAPMLVTVTATMHWRDAVTGFVH